MTETESNHGEGRKACKRYGNANKRTQTITMILKPTPTNTKRPVTLDLPRGDARTKTRSPSKRYPADRHGSKRIDAYHTGQAQQVSPRDRHRDEALLDLAATKIQATFRGYTTRKEFYRQRERYRGQQNHSQVGSYRQDEYSLPSMTSIVDSSGSLPVNADPNLGLTAPLPPTDSSQRNHILRDLKSKLTFSDELPTASQLQLEYSPTVVVLGGMNPHNPEDYLLGASMFIYNVQKDKWLFGGTMPEPRSYHGAAFTMEKFTSRLLALLSIGPTKSDWLFEQLLALFPVEQL
ncbi:beta-scruin [Caerostris extrusa]|uniref:Beta-scruin n=1 Tax=Caerostris extrusa TaxID=172846 RepID=A0AAV4VMK7_CAEEX|nr:beta-scruin [Caerostris extrusa]